MRRIEPDPLEWSRVTVSAAALAPHTLTAGPMSELLARKGLLSAAAGRRRERATPGVDGAA